jgi:hypothetical protein
MDNGLIVPYHRAGAMKGRRRVAQPLEWMAVPSEILNDGVGKSAPERKA